MSDKKKGHLGIFIYTNIQACCIDTVCTEKKSKNRLRETRVKCILSTVFRCKQNYSCFKNADFCVDYANNKIISFDTHIVKI